MSRGRLVLGGQTDRGATPLATRSWAWASSSAGHSMAAPSAAPAWLRGGTEYCVVWVLLRRSQAMVLFVGDTRARRACEVDHFRRAEARLAAPPVEVRAREV